MVTKVYTWYIGISQYCATVCLYASLNHFVGTVYTFSCIAAIYHMLWHYTWRWQVKLIGLENAVKHCCFFNILKQNLNFISYWSIHVTTVGTVFCSCFDVHCRTRRDTHSGASKTNLLFANQGLAPNEKRAYCFEKLYAGNSECSFEELRAWRWQAKKKEQEEAQKRVDQLVNARVEQLKVDFEYVLYWLTTILC